MGGPAAARPRSIQQQCAPGDPIGWPGRTALAGCVLGPGLLGEGQAASCGLSPVDLASTRARNSSEQLTSWHLTLGRPLGRCPFPFCTFCGAPFPPKPPCITIAHTWLRHQLTQSPAASLSQRALGGGRRPVAKSVCTCSCDLILDAAAACRHALILQGFSRDAGDSQGGRWALSADSLGVAEQHPRAALGRHLLGGFFG